SGYRRSTITASTSAANTCSIIRCFSLSPVRCRTSTTFSANSPQKLNVIGRTSSCGICIIPTSASNIPKNRSGCLTISLIHASPASVNIRHTPRILSTSPCTIASMFPAISCNLPFKYSIFKSSTSSRLSSISSPSSFPSLSLCSSRPLRSISFSMLLSYIYPHIASTATSITSSSSDLSPANANSISGV
ncbi:hypothetical protein AX774_g7755, partial [Zancudomyces culisetae]